MNISGIISISGRPGLYKVLAQGKNSVIVESVTDKKRFPAYASDRISALEDISIYTYEDDKPLKDIFEGMYSKTEGKEAPSHKEDISTLQEFLSDVLPNYDEERVYPSDIKKLFQWFNTLLKVGLLAPEKKEVKKKPVTKKAPAKKKEASKTAEEKKPAAKKKAPAKKKPATKKAETEKKPAAKKKETKK